MCKVQEETGRIPVELVTWSVHKRLIGYTANPGSKNKDLKKKSIYKNMQIQIAQTFRFLNVSVD